MMSLRTVAPASLKRFAKTLFPPTPWNHPRLRTCGVVEDLYYWVADGRLDTLLPIQNFFSVFFPDLQTATSGTVFLYARDGTPIGDWPFTLGPHALVTRRISTMLRELGTPSPDGYGTLLCDLHVPEAVQQFVGGREPFYFWDRSYIGYLSGHHQPCFVHGIDKTYVRHTRSPRQDTFYPAGKRYPWVPEPSITLTACKQVWIILMNRTARATSMTLTATDQLEHSRSWSPEVPPFGVHRFELHPANSEGLHPEGIRLRLEGMPTRWGRPVIFKEFSNGAITAMHC